jgi:hypothetical protein
MMTLVGWDVVKGNSKYSFCVQLLRSGEAHSREWRLTDSFSSVAAVCFNGMGHDCRDSVTQTGLGLI